MINLRTYAGFGERLAFADAGQQGPGFSRHRREDRDVPHRATEDPHGFVVDITRENHAALAWTSMNTSWIRCPFAVMWMRQRCQLPHRKFLLHLHLMNPRNKHGALRMHSIN